MFFQVWVEGNIGSGKTTLLDYFKDVERCEALYEPVDRWRNVGGINALKRQNGDPERWGMTMQSYIQLTMMQQHKKIQVKPVHLLERSIFSGKYCFVDGLFKGSKMSQLEHNVLTEWFEWLITTQSIKVDLIVYLQTDPEVCLERIKTRGREEDKATLLEDLRAIHQSHEDWLIHKKSPCPAPVLVIDANKSKEEMQRFYEEHKNQILCL